MLRRLCAVLVAVFTPELVDSALVVARAALDQASATSGMQTQKKAARKFSSFVFKASKGPQSQVLQKKARKKETLVLAAHRKTGYQLTRWAMRCVKRFSKGSCLDAIALPGHKFEKKWPDAGSKLIHFIRDPVDLAVNDYFYARNQSRDDDHILPGTATEVQTAISEHDKSRQAWMKEVDSRMTYQHFLRTVSEEKGLRVHLAHLLPEVASMEKVAARCKKATARCLQVPSEAFTTGTEAFMTKWANIMQFAGVDLNSSEQKTLKDCLASEDPNSAAFHKMVKGGKRQAMASHLSSEELQRFKQIANSVDKADLGGKLTAASEQIKPKAK